MSKKKYLVTGIILVVFIVILSILIGVFKNKEMKKGPLDETKMQEVTKKLRKLIDVDPKHYEYYAGMYEENQKIVLVLVKNKEVGSDVMDYVESEDTITVKYVKYSWVELNDKYKEIGKKYKELQEEGKLARDLRDSGYEGEIIDEKKNRVVVKFHDINNKKVREFKKIFGDSEMVCYMDSEKYHEELYEELGRPYLK